MAHRTGRTRVIRAAALLAVWLALGAVVNLAIAWICVLRAPRVLEDLTITSSETVTRDPADPRPVTRRTFTMTQAPVVGVQTEYWTKELDSEGDYLRDGTATSTVTLASGWPCRSFQSTEVFHGIFVGTATAIMPSDWSIWKKGIAPPAAVRRHFDSALAVANPTFVGHPHTLPIRPLWPGFAINTIVYATLLWSLFALPFMARRALRRRRGTCRACGYALVGLAEKGITVCPECGAKVQPASAAAGAAAPHSGQTAPAESPARS